MNRYDIRLTPQSTESYTLMDRTVPGLEIVVSHVTQIRGRTSTRFVSMTEFAGVTSTDEPVTLAGLVFTGIEGLTVQVWDTYGHDFLNNLYFRADYEVELREGLLLFGAAQVLDQQDVGDAAGGGIDTGNFAGMAGVGLWRGRVSFAAARNRSDHIFFAWGHDFIVNTPVFRCFRADEIGLQAVLRYDFGGLGLHGLEGKAAYTSFDTPDDGTKGSPDRESLDLELKYVFQGFLKGLSLKWRLGFYDLDEALGGEDLYDLRIYVKYAW